MKRVSFSKRPMRQIAILFLSVFLICGICSAQQSNQDRSLDPEEGRYFIVSTVIELTSLPKPQDRISIFSKLTTFNRTAVGYGLSLRGFQTSVRPQLYWSSGEGDGGFYTFGSFDFKARHRYALTLIARPGEFISMYIQERDRQNSESAPSGRSTSKVFFLGGHDMKGVSAPKNSASFNYKVEDEADREEHAVVDAVLVAITNKLKDSIDKLLLTLDNAPESLAKSLRSDEVRLWEVSSVPEATK